MSQKVQKLANDSYFMKQSSQHTAKVKVNLRHTTVFIFSFALSHTFLIDLHQKSTLIFDYIFFFLTCERVYMITQKKPC